MGEAPIDANCPTATYMIVRRRSDTGLSPVFNCKMSNIGIKGKRERAELLEFIF